MTYLNHFVQRSGKHLPELSTYIQHVDFAAGNHDLDQASIVSPDALWTRLIHISKKTFNIYSVCSGGIYMLKYQQYIQFLSLGSYLESNRLEWGFFFKSNPVAFTTPVQIAFWQKAGFTLGHLPSRPLTT